MINRIRGALFGTAIGDALGGTTEFMTHEEIRKKFGWLNDIVGGGVWELKPGETTDDTAMTLAVTRGILQNPKDPIPQIGEQFLQWRATTPKDIGMTISTVFGLYNGNWSKASRQARKLLDEKVAGNGSLMRCLPVALFYIEKDKMEEITKLQSLMTHDDDLATEACLIHNRIAYRLLQGEELVVAISSEVSLSKYEGTLEGKVPAVPPNGFVVNTFKWVLYHLLSAKSFEEVVQAAANMGGDSDTIGAIAGGLAGLYWGYEGIPEKYVEKILKKSEIIIAAELIESKRREVEIG